MFDFLIISLIAVSAIYSLFCVVYKKIAKEENLVIKNTFFPSLFISTTLFVLYTQFPIFLETRVILRLFAIFVISLFLALWSSTKEVKKGDKPFEQVWAPRLITILLINLLWILFSDKTIESFIKETDLQGFTLGRSVGEELKVVIYDMQFVRETPKCRFEGNIHVNFPPQKNIDQYILIKEHKSNGQVVAKVFTDKGFDFNPENHLSFSAPNGCGNCMLTITYKNNSCIK